MVGAIGVIVIAGVFPVAMLGIKREQVWHYGNNIRPTGQLWEILSEELRSEDYDAARKDLELIQAEWGKVSGRSGGYSASEILKRLERENE